MGAIHIAHGGAWLGGVHEQRDRLRSTRSWVNMAPPRLAREKKVWACWPRDCIVRAGLILIHTHSQHVHMLSQGSMCEIAWRPGVKEQPAGYKGW